MIVRSPTFGSATKAEEPCKLDHNVVKPEQFICNPEKHNGNLNWFKNLE